MTDGTYTLIVAIYNHANYLAATQPERDLARTFARETFGYRDPVNPNRAYPAVMPLQDRFEYLGAFPYKPVPCAAAEDEEKRQDYIWGWVAIMETEAALSFRSATANGGSEFWNIFADTQITTPIVYVPSALQKDAVAWETQGYEVYDRQTPDMWKL